MIKIFKKIRQNYLKEGKTSEYFKYAITEFFLVPSGIHGIRLLSEKNSFDIGGLIIPEITDLIPVLPYARYVRIF